MAIQSFIADYSYIWLFVILVVLIYAALKTIKLPGNDMALAAVSVLVSALLIASDSVTTYLIGVIPFLTLIAGLIFLFLIMLALLVTKDWNPFKKPMAWIGFALAILICLTIAFNQFPVLNHMLPNSSDSGLNENLSEFKEFLYSSTFKESAIFIVSAGLICFFLLKKASG